MRTIIFVAALLMSTLTSATQAEQTTPEQISRAASEFLATFSREQAEAGYEVSHELGSLDPRLALAPCGQALDVAFSGDPWRSTQPTLLVSCEGERPWRMYLPASVSITGDALVATRPLTRGERISGAMVDTAPVVVNATRRGVITDVSQLVGMEMRRAVNRGTVFTPDLLVSPPAIERGDHVIISASSGRFSVNSRGKALSSAKVGDQVLVENLSSSRTVRARVTAPGRVEIAM